MKATLIVHAVKKPYYSKIVTGNEPQVMERNDWMV